MTISSRSLCIRAAAIIAIAVGCTTATAAETASSWIPGYNSKVRLLAGMIAGKPVAGVEMQLADGWKTYWRSPGDSGGVPPHFDWTGSGNLARAQVLYPAPGRMVDPAGDAVGYKSSVIFPVALASEDASKPIRLLLVLEYGICRDICVPAEAKLELEIPAKGLATAGDGLTKALDSVPRKTRRAGDPELVKGTARLAGDKPVLVIEARFQGGARGTDAFIEAPDGIYLPLPKKTGEPKDGRVIFEVDLRQGAEPGDLKGKTLTVTLVSDAGQSETPWPID